MKLLLDSCISPRTRDQLQEFGHDVAWVGDWADDPGDDEILSRAVAEARIIVTLDKDFGELVFARNRAHCGLIRLVGIRASQQAPLCQQVLQRYSAELHDKAIITVDAGRARIRRYPS